MKEKLEAATTTLHAHDYKQAMAMFKEAGQVWKDISIHVVTKGLETATNLQKEQDVCMRMEEKKE